MVFVSFEYYFEVPKKTSILFSSKNQQAILLSHVNIKYERFENLYLIKLLVWNISKCNFDFINVTYIVIIYVCVRFMDFLTNNSNEKSV